MRKNNRPGEGSISKRTDGVYQASIMIEGVRKYLYAPTEKEVREKLKAYQVKNYLGYKDCEIKFSDYFERWLNNVKKKSLKPASFDRLERTYRLYLKDSIGKIKIGSLGTCKCQTIINDASERLSYSTVKKIYEALNACLKYAHAINDISKNPMNAVEMPKESSFNKETKEIVIPTTEEMAAVFKVAEECFGNGKPIYNQDYVNAYRFICETGLRAGELLALKWNKVSFDGCTAKIDESVSEVINRSKKADGSKKIKRITTTTKTKSGSRVIHLNSEAISVLRTIQNNNTSRGITSDSVVCNSKGEPTTYHDLERTLGRICKKAGVDPFGLHVLRHYFASRCIANGVDILALSKHLGHSKPSITMNVYAHLLPKQNIAFQNALENLSN